MTKKTVLLDFGGCMALLRIIINKPALLFHILNRYELKTSDKFVDMAKKEIKTVKEDVIREEYNALFDMCKVKLLT